MSDLDFMRTALELAHHGVGWTSPNPVVGAVIVRDGRIIGRGWHHEYGGAHAEVDALRSCRTSPRGATMYVTLEPCAHQGKQPPCTDAILAAGIARVVVGSADPNPVVNGAGVQRLRDHGVVVTEHVLDGECEQANEIFFHYITTGTPLVTMKYAMTMDGKIASVSGDARWVTGEPARRRVHEDRHRFAAIMVGVGTVLADDPMLTCRLPHARNPVRIICDSHLRIPLDSRIVATAHEVPTLIATCSSDATRQASLHQRGCQILRCGVVNGRVDLAQLMTLLASREIDSVLLEGGGTLNWGALSAGIVHRFQAFIAPRILGGTTAPSPVQGPGITRLADAVHLRTSQVTRLGDDLLIEGAVHPISPPARNNAPPRNAT